MKNKSVFVLLLSSLLLFSCGSLSKGSETPSSGGNQENTPSEPGETDPGTGGGSTSGDSTGGGSSTIIGEDPEEGSEDWQLGRVKLPNYADGYELYSCGKPINYNSPFEMPTTFTNTDDQWLKGDWSESIPSDWIYSTGNSYSNGPSGTMLDLQTSTHLMMDMALNSLKQTKDSALLDSLIPEKS